MVAAVIVPPPLGVSKRDGQEFRRCANNVLDGDDHGRNSIVIAVLIVLVDNRKRAKQQPAMMPLIDGVRQCLRE